jgi:hypothetical protein
LPGNPLPAVPGFPGAPVPPLPAAVTRTNLFGDVQVPGALNVTLPANCCDPLNSFLVPKDILFYIKPTCYYVFSAITYITSM